MTDWLLRLFVYRKREPASPDAHGAVGKLAGVTGIVCNSLLALGKILVGWLSGSVSVLADGLNNFSDAASSVVTLVGFRLAQRPADRDHPFGHARYEYLSGMLVTVLILLVGAELAKSSVEKIFHPSPLHLSVVAVVVLVVSVIVKLWLAVFFKKLGKKICSAVLLASSADSRNDVLASAAVLLGCLLYYFFQWNVDGFIGLAVAVFIFISGIRTAKDTVSLLIGKQAEPALLEQIGQIILSHERVRGFHDLLVHDYGPGQCYASVHAEVSAKESLLSCHEMMDEIETETLEKLRVHLVIHCDPVAEDDEELNAARRLTEDILLRIDPRLSAHDFRIVRSSGHTGLIFDLSVPYEKLRQRDEIKRRIDAELEKNGVPYPTVIRFDGKG